MLPTEFSEQLGREYLKQVSAQYKKALGQFFTPVEIARFMAEKINISKEVVKILDPCFGTGILTCALVENLAMDKKIKVIELIAYEIDAKLIKHSESVLQFLKKWLAQKNISFKYILFINDFIIENSKNISGQNLIFEADDDICYDVVISNPPYFKLSIDDERAILTKDIINGHPNIYAIFMYLSAKLLKTGGEFVYIVPRSFASGQYFKLFREKFFESVKPEWIHLFESRKKQFDKDNVLQENVIIKGTKSKGHSPRENVIISSSKDYQDLTKAKIKKFKINDIIDLKSKQKILHIPTNNEESRVVKQFKKWDGRLNKYHLQISTGPVVTFRLKGFVSLKKNDNTYVPLYDLHNITQMKFNHPIKKNGKGQFIQACEKTKQALLNNKNYVFLRRFSTKEDAKRLVASPYFMDITKSELIGVENHLNYIYRPNGFMSRNEVLGISALLNSKLFDRYFRIFNGNINVSATELRAIPLPPLELIKKIGDLLILENNFNETNIEHIIQEILFEKQN